MGLEWRLGWVLRITGFFYLNICYFVDLGLR